MKLKTEIILCLAFIAQLTYAQQNNAIDKIIEVENNLIPYVPVKGFKGWNIIDRMKYYKVPGVSVAVIKDYKIAWAKGYGLADTIKKTLVNTETMFSAGSISKFVSAVAAFSLVQDGKLALDTPINNYLKSWKITENDFTKKTPVTLKMLLSHTAGTSQTSYFGFTPDKKPLPTIVDILSGAPNSESRPVVVNSDPKKEFRYSGGGSMIAQLAMMDVTNQSFADFTQKAVFDKLGMKNSTFEQPLPKKYDSKAAWAYSNASWFKGMPYVYPQQAAAGLYSTPTDLAKFFIDVQKSYINKGTILNQNMAKKMLTPQVEVSNGGYRERIAVGPFLIQRNDVTDDKGVYFEFTGVNAGFLAYGMASLVGGNGVIVMLNSGDDVNGLGKEIRRAVAKAYNWNQFLPKEISPVKLTTDELRQYTGRYRKAVDEVVYIKVEKDYWIENINEGGDIYCFPIAKDSLVFTDYNIKGSFIRDNQNNIIGLQNEYQDKPMMKMKDDEFSPSEYLKAKRYSEAKETFKVMNMNEYQITYYAYDLLNKKPFDTKAVRTILELAVEQHPKSSIVYSRWGDFYQKLNDKQNSIKSYEKAVELDPTDKQTVETLAALKNK